MTSISVPILRPRLNRAIAAAAVTVTLAGGTLALALSDNPQAPTVPTPAQATGSAQDLSSFDPALLHHHGMEVSRAAAAPPSSTPSQRAAAERFHHRR